MGLNGALNALIFQSFLGPAPQHSSLGGQRGAAAFPPGALAAQEGDLISLQSRTQGHLKELSEADGPAWGQGTREQKESPLGLRAAMAGALEPDCLRMSPQMVALGE